MDNLNDIIGSNPNIIRRNDENELKVDGHAVPGSYFDQIYSAVVNSGPLRLRFCLKTRSGL